MKATTPAAPNPPPITVHKVFVFNVLPAAPPVDSGTMGVELVDELWLVRLGMMYVGVLVEEEEG